MEGSDSFCNFVHSVFQISDKIDPHCSGSDANSPDCSKNKKSNYKFNQ